MAVTVEPVEGGLGARIKGLDLANTPAEEAHRIINEAILAHHVVAIPGQALDALGLVRISSQFGELEPHVLDQYHHPDHPAVIVLSNAQEAGKPKGFKTPEDPKWHSDLSYRPRPTSLSFLYAVRVPEEGGDTLFANMVQAYEDMSDDLKRQLEGLRAIHNYEYRTKRLTDSQRAKAPDSEHPVVRSHPVTGRKAIFINPTFTVRICGMDDEAGEALKQAVFAHCLQERYQYRHKWQDGELVIWDNAAVQHAATPPVYEQERTLLRTTVMGSEPR